jgi:hypothetical protein
MPPSTLPGRERVGRARLLEPVRQRLIELLRRLLSRCVQSRGACSQTARNRSLRWSSGTGSGRSKKISRRPRRKKAPAKIRCALKATRDFVTTCSEGPAPAMSVAKRSQSARSSSESGSRWTSSGTRGAGKRDEPYPKGALPPLHGATPRACRSGPRQSRRRATKPTARVMAPVACFLCSRSCPRTRQRKRNLRRRR